MKINLENISDMVKVMPGINVAYQLLENKKIKRICISDEIYELYGVEPSEYQAEGNPFDVVLEEDRIVIQNKVNECIEHSEIQKAELVFRLIHRTKGFIWVHMTASRVGEMDGTVIVLAHVLDVTKEMLSSYALMEASDRYICVIEKSTKRFLYANHAFYDLIDSSPAEAMGKHCYELLCKTMEMRDNDGCLCYSSLNVETPIETYNPLKDKYLTLKGREAVWGEYDAYVFFMTDITSEKRKDELLEDSRKRFNVALDNSDLMIWEYDMVNHRCINSEKAGRDYNIPIIIENYPESLFETGHVPPETIEQIKEVKKRLESGETGFSVERRTVDKYGRSNWQKVDYTLECDKDGKPIRAIVCGLDITAQKELEQKYEEQMEYRNNLAQKALFSIRLDLDADSISDYICNLPELESIMEVSPTAATFLIKFFTTSIFDPDDEVSRECLRIEALKEAYSLGRSQYQTTYQCSMLNKYLELNLTMYKNPGNNHLEAFFVITDVTENTLMHTAFQNVVSKDYDFVAVANVSTGRTMFLAKTEADLIPDIKKSDNYNTVVTEFAREHTTMFYSQDDFLAVSKGMLLENILQKLEEKDVYEFNYKTRFADGSVRTYRMSFCYTDTSKTQLMFTRANVTNAIQDEQKNQRVLEEALKAAKKADKAKTDFLSRMSHDMRTPMNGILGMTRLTQDIPDLTPEIRSNLMAIEDSSNYLLSLINDTLDMNKIESNKFTLHPEVVNVGELIEHIIATITPLANQKQIQLEFVPINAQLEYVLVDRVRVQQLFMNVLSNSVKFTPVGGKIHMEVECLKREHGIAFDRISVEDNGCGMSEEFLQHIFEPFTQEHNGVVNAQEGTGLGMAIVKNLVEMMGGTVEIESRLGKGTKVTAYMNFQRVYDVPESQQSGIKAVRGDLEGKRVLLVEDHPLNATIARRLLEKKGMLVEHATDGSIAVQMVKNSELCYYDLILMDIRMPVMDGLEATRQIRGLDRSDAQKVPIIAMTANAYDTDVRDALNAGMNAHLAKPIEPEVLYIEMEKYI